MSIETYGRYQLLKKIATGGMAQIFLAKKQGVDGFVVIKRILPHLTENADFIRMFLDEARIAARLNHPNVVQILDLGAQDESFFIAMEFIHGDDLRRVWKHADSIGKPLPVPLICRIIADAAAGLDYAHKKTDQNGRPLSIVHRDISPQNILVSFDGVAKVVDFGIAKAADQATVTKSGVLKGKFSYMSPEQALGKPLDNRSDVFALGIVLYELLTGTRLFKRSNDLQTLNAVTACEVHPPSEVNMVLPESLDPIVLKALGKEPKDRYVDCKALQQALEDWMRAQKQLASTRDLSAFMHEVFAERLKQEEKEGRLLLTQSNAIESELAEDPAPAQKNVITRDAPIPPIPRVSVKSSARVPVVPPPPEATVAMEEPEEKTAPLPAEHTTERPRTSRTETKSIDVTERARSQTSTEQALGDRPRTRPWWLLGVGGALAVLALAGWAISSPAKTTAPKAAVTVLYRPAEAALVFDGAPLPCHSPCRLPERPAGTYSLTLSAPGFEAVNTTVVFGDNGNRTEQLTLKPSKTGGVPKDLPGTETVVVSFSSEPSGAKVSLDQVLRGVTPFDLKLPAGSTIEVQLTHDGYLPIDDKLTVGSANESHAWELQRK